MPLSLRRNADLEEGCEQLVAQDIDEQGEYFGASLRKGPFMTVQEDRVSYSHFSY